MLLNRAFSYIAVDYLATVILQIDYHPSWAFDHDFFPKINPLPHQPLADQFQALNT